MYTTVYEKSPKFLACWCVYRLANVTAWSHLLDAAHKIPGATND